MNKISFNNTQHRVSLTAVPQSDWFWSDQEVLYDYNADLHGIGNRSLL